MRMCLVRTGKSRFTRARRGSLPRYGSHGYGKPAPGERTHVCKQLRIRTLAEGGKKMGECPLPCTQTPNHALTDARTPSTWPWRGAGGRGRGRGQGASARDGCIGGRRCYKGVSEPHVHSPHLRQPPHKKRTQQGNNYHRYNTRHHYT